MQTTDKITQLLLSIDEQKGGKANINHEAIQTGLAGDAAAYQGLAITLLSIAGGILGTLFLLGFVGLAIANSPEATLVTGIILISAAVWVNKASQHTLLDTASVTAFLAGFGIAIYGMIQLHVGDEMLTLVLMLFAAATIALQAGYC